MPSTRRIPPPPPGSGRGSRIDQLYGSFLDRLEQTENHRFEAYASDPVGFVEAVLGQRPWAKQAEILRAVAGQPQTTVRSSHGVGKTWVAACCALWWVYSHSPALVLTTAPTARQVEGLLWAEIHRLWHGANERQGEGTRGRGDEGGAGRGKGGPAVDFVGSPRLPLAPSPRPVLPGRCLQTRLVASRQQTALGLSTNEPEKFAGWHCEHLLVIVDEASGVPDSLFEVIQGTLTAAHCRLLLIGNPTRTAGGFFASHHRAGWTKLRISAYDTPNFAGEGVQAFGRSGVQVRPRPASDSAGPERLNARTPERPTLPCPWLVTPQWVEARRREWGEASDAFRVRVLGEFPRASADSLIELAWVERAEAAGSEGAVSGQRTAFSSGKDNDFDLSGAESCPLTADRCVFGLDVARFGDCETVLAIRRGETLAALERWSGADLMATCGRVMAAARREQPERIVIDGVGMGAGVVDRLRELQRDGGADPQGGAIGGIEIVLFSSGERASDPAQWKSRRDEAYWALRERYREGRIAHAATADGEAGQGWSGLTGQLTALRYRYTSRGQVEIESKDELRRRGIPSPDQADAVALAFAPLAAPAFLPAALASHRPVAWPLPRLGEF
jgi:hypothetical protein